MFRESALMGQPPETSAEHILIQHTRLSLPRPVHQGHSLYVSLKQSQVLV